MASAAQRKQMMMMSIIDFTTNEASSCDVGDMPQTDGLRPLIGDAGNGFEMTVRSCGFRVLFLETILPSIRGAD